MNHAECRMPFRKTGKMQDGRRESPSPGLFTLWHEKRLMKASAPAADKPNKTQERTR
jgi:hypothetical protein